MKGTREPKSYSHYYPLLQSCWNLQRVQAPVQCHQPSLHARWSTQPLQNSRIFCSANPTGNWNPKARTETARTELLFAACITVQNTRAFYISWEAQWHPGVTWRREQGGQGARAELAEGWAPALGWCYCCCTSWQLLLPHPCFTPCTEDFTPTDHKLVLCLARTRFISACCSSQGSAGHVGAGLG